MGHPPTTEQTIIAKTGSPLPTQLKADGKGCLVKIYPTETGPQLIELPDDPIVIGRGKECQIELEDTAVSRQHAKIEPKLGNYVLADLDSTNGTFVNDEAIEKRFLVAGDLVRIGSTIMKFLSSDHIETQYHETIYSMMIHDGLTGIHNKRYFLETIERELVRTARHRRPLGLAIFDIDHFKEINDQHGHLVGDAVLRELTARLKETIRRDEIFARYGGEEFVVLLPESTLEKAVGFGERLRRLVADEPFDGPDGEFQVTVSVGIAETNGERVMTPEELIGLADSNLYVAKRNGRNRIYYVGASSSGCWSDNELSDED
ncbi:Response regulator PleD [Planctomycetes bacterium Pan216]|uniref:diguanylate cyclase n=1 Tax=Kolteria novifilia TaxID=2527975 RepID=A0A518BCV0_9BACT|nr:Response regulator PleD [Planctomycetes bacterium Pan216]